MIRQCFEQDRAQVMDYLNKERVLNLFFVGDINNFGFDHDFQKVYMDEDEQGVIQAVYLRYHDSFLMSSYTKTIDQEFVNRIIQEEKIMHISGEQSCVDAIELAGFKNDDCYFCKMVNQPELPTKTIEVATIEDIPEINQVLTAAFDHEVVVREETLLTKTGRTYFMRENGKIVAVASSTAETDGLAMIVGVGTIEECRGKGYASEVMKKLCSDLLKEDKVPCLFYNNPAAGRIYHRLGFEDIGRWALRRNEVK